MRIAVIGAGNVGRAVGAGWTRAGHEVVYGVRDPGAAKNEELRATGSRVATAPDAAADAPVVVLALPWTGAESAVRALGPLVGKVVLDCMNPLMMGPEGLALDRGFTTSGGETVASWLAQARVVKTLNQVGAEIMATAGTLGARPIMFVAGDDADAKATATSLVGDLGFEVQDAGGLRQARLLEPLAMLWINQALFRGQGRDWAFGAIRRAGAAA